MTRNNGRTSTTAGTQLYPPSKWNACRFQEIYLAQHEIPVTVVQEHDQGIPYIHTSIILHNNIIHFINHIIIILYCRNCVVLIAVTMRIYTSVEIDKIQGRDVHDYSEK